MPELSLIHIDRITKDIQNEDISFSHLVHDLIDHVCCDVENEMMKGSDFSEAYRRVKKKMGSRRIKEIQEETLFAVDTKYRKMKKTMKISGITGASMLGISAVLKILHLPFAGILLTLGALSLALLFVPSAMVVLWKESHSKKRLTLFISAFTAGSFYILGALFKIQHWPGAGLIIMLAILSGMIFFIPSLLITKLREAENGSKRLIYITGSVGLMIYIAGFLFKIMHWPMASLLMIVGLIVLFFIVFPWYTRVSWKNEESVSASFIFLVVAPLSFVIPGALVNLNLERSYEEGFFINMDNQNAIYSFSQNQTNLVMDKYADSAFFPTMAQLHDKSSDVLALISSIEKKMLEGSQGTSELPLVTSLQIKAGENTLGIDYLSLKDPFYPAPVKDFLMPGSSSRVELDNAISEYNKYLSEVLTITNVKSVTKLLDPSSYLPGTNPEKGEMPLMSALNSLSMLKNSVLIAESYAMKSIISNN